jgi:hypothetical protein
MIYYEYKYAYPDDRGVASFGRCNVPFEQHLDHYDIRPDMANILQVRPDQIVILSTTMIDTSRNESRLGVWEITPELLDKISNCCDGAQSDWDTYADDAVEVRKWVIKMRDVLRQTAA